MARRGMPPACSSVLIWHLKKIFQIRRYSRDITFVLFLILPNGKAGTAIRQENSETNGAVETS
jgi:hypothetical protein